MKFKLVTSFNPTLWENYVRQLIGPLLGHYKGTGEIWCYLDNDQEREMFEDSFTKSNPSITNVRWSSVDQNPEAIPFHALYGGNQPFELFKGSAIGGINEENMWRYTGYLGWAFKIFAWTQAYFEESQKEDPADYLVWVDADVTAFADFDDNTLEELVAGGKFDLAWLDRELPFKHPETGFFMIKVGEPGSDVYSYVVDVLNEYSSGSVFYGLEWHDCWVMKNVLNRNYSDVLAVKNLNRQPIGVNSQVFNTSPLNNFLIHYKGKRKEQFSTKNDEPGTLYIDE